MGTGRGGRWAVAQKLGHPLVQTGFDPLGSATFRNSTELEGEPRGGSIRTGRRSRRLRWRRSRGRFDLSCRWASQERQKGFTPNVGNRLRHLAGAERDGGHQRVVSVSAVIPTLNEAANLPHVFARRPECVDDLIVVDGHSTDDTIKVARELRPSVRVVLQEGRGRGDTLACGFAAAPGDIIVMLDADGSTDPAEIPLFVDSVLQGADLAKGSRFVAGGGTVDITALA